MSASPKDLLIEILLFSILDLPQFCNYLESAPSKCYFDLYHFYWNSLTSAINPISSIKCIFFLWLPNSYYSYRLWVWTGRFGGHLNLFGKPKRSLFYFFGWFYPSLESPRRFSELVYLLTLHLILTDRWLYHIFCPLRGFWNQLKFLLEFKIHSSVHWACEMFTWLQSSRQQNYFEFTLYF